MLTKFYPLANGQRQELKINIKKQRLIGILVTTAFEDNGYQIVYIPTLNLTGYGESREEAFKLLQIELDEFFHDLFALAPSKIIAELKNLGWKRNPIFEHEFSTDVHIDEQGVLKNFNLPAETNIESQLVEMEN